MWVMQQDNNPKHTSHSTKVNVLEWLSQSPELNPIINVVEGPKQAVHRRKPTNISEFKWFCTKEWAKTPTCYCAGLISIYKETLPSVTAAKEGHTRYWKQRFTYFCNAQICNTGSFFSINKWQRKYISLTCSIRFSLSTFRTYMKIGWCFGSYLWAEI